MKFFVLASLLLAAFAATCHADGKIGGAGAAAVVSQPPQSVVVVNAIPAAQTQTGETVVEPVVQPTIINPLAQGAAVNPSISSTSQTTQVTVIDVPTPTQNIQCRASTYLNASVGCASRSHFALNDFQTRNALQTLFAMLMAHAGRFFSPQLLRVDKLNLLPQLLVSQLWFLAVSVHSQFLFNP